MERVKVIPESDLVTLRMTKGEAIDLLAALEGSGIQLSDVGQDLLDQLYGFPDFDRDRE